MQKNRRARIAALLVMLLMGGIVIWGVISAGAAVGETAGGLVSYGRRTGAQGTYDYLTVTGLTPHVFAPGGAEGAGQTNAADLVRTRGEELGVCAASNAGIVWQGRADGVVIAGGVVLQSAESVGRTECDILVVDEDGNLGWADYWADADALAAGTGTYYDVNGQAVTGKRVVSAVTGFVPVVIAGRNVYDPADAALHGYDNYDGDYDRPAERQLLGVRADGTYVILSGAKWTLDDAGKTALAENCVFAYALGGGSETVAAGGTADGYEIKTVRKQSEALPTYLVFTAADAVPESAAPTGITAVINKIVLPVGVSWPELAQALTVTEVFENADGGTSSRLLHSRQGVVNADAPIEHHIIGGGASAALCEVKKTSLSPNGWLTYMKTEKDTAFCLRNYSSTRANGAYYDYSTGYAMSTADNLNTPGVKTITVTYAPGGGREPLTTRVAVTLG